MNYRLAILATLAVGAILAAPATVSAQKRSKAPAKKVVKKAPAKAEPRDENGLVGVHLFDPATVVLNKFGSPNEIEAVGISSASVGPVGPSGGQGIGGPASPQGAGPGVPPGMGIPGAGGGGGGGSAGAIGVTSPSNDFGFGSTLFMQEGKGKNFEPPQASGGGQTVRGGPPGPGPSGGPGGAGRAIGGSGSATSTNFTRWIYNRPNSKYAFIVNKQGRIVQIEAIGIKDAAVRTNRGTSFGAPFASLVKAYGNPDGYDIAGDSFVVRFLQKNKVAFRLSRLDEKKGHVVTGVVVAGGKD